MQVACGLLMQMVHRRLHRLEASIHPVSSIVLSLHVLLLDCRIQANFLTYSQSRNRDHWSSQHDLHPHRSASASTSLAICRFVEVLGCEVKVVDSSCEWVSG